MVSRLGNKSIESPTERTLIDEPGSKTRKFLPKVDNKYDAISAFNHDTFGRTLGFKKS